MISFVEQASPVGGILALERFGIVRDLQQAAASGTPIDCRRDGPRAGAACETSKFSVVVHGRTIAQRLGAAARVFLATASSPKLDAQARKPSGEIRGITASPSARSLPAKRPAEWSRTPGSPANCVAAAADLAATVRARRRAFLLAHDFRVPRRQTNDSFATSRQEPNVPVGTRITRCRDERR